MNKAFYIKNREDLVRSITETKAIIVLSSGYSINRSADENYEFQVNNNFYYLTGINQTEVHLLIIKDNDSYFEQLYISEYDEMYEKWIGHRLTIKEASKISGIFPENISYLDEFEDDIKLLKDYKVMYLDLEEKDNINYNSFALTLKEKAKKAFNIKNVYENIVRLRMVKKPCEIKAFKKAIDITNDGILALMRNAKPNIYEYQLEAFFDYTIKDEGNNPVSFKTIAASGINATTLHYSNNNSLIKDNDLILFDLGCKYNNYCADISRTFPINGKFSELQKKIYSIVLKANKQICKIAKANMTIRQLQEICKDILATECLKASLIKNKEEISKHYFHSVSHSIGLDTHDPFIKDTPLPVNAIISNEPGLYFKEYGIGIRIEDDLLIKENHAINLSKKIIKEIKDIEDYMERNKN